MSILSPVDRRFVDKIKLLETANYQAQVNDPVPAGDWIPRNPSNYAYETSNSLLVSNSETSILNKSDKIRIKFSGDSSYRYFYLTDKTSTTITIEAGTDFVASNLTVTEFAYSRSSNPSGFPGSFEFDPDWNNNGGLTPITVAYSGGMTVAETLFRFSIVGSEVNIRIVANTLTLGGSVNPYIYGILPITPINFGAGFNPEIFIPMYNSQDSIGMGFLIMAYFTVGDIPRFQVVKNNFSNYALGNGVLDFQITFSYLY